MGTWDVGPFDNDTAADFAGDLDDAAESERENMIRHALTRTVDTPDYLDSEVAVHVTECHERPAARTHRSLRACTRATDGGWPCAGSPWKHPHCGDLRKQHATHRHRRLRGSAAKLTHPPHDRVGRPTPSGSHTINIV